jgi:hypothetical protein
MEYLTLQNRRCEGDQIADEAFISAKDRDVVIIGAATRRDCLGRRTGRARARFTSWS